MRLGSIFRLRLRSLVSRTEVEQELDEELEYHLNRQIEENLAAGMKPREARLAALRSLVGVEQAKENCRDMRGWNWMDNLLRDTRFALRQLRQTPGFACTAILVLAMGMCASVAIFAFVDAALLKPLPYRDPARLAGAFETVPMIPQSNLSYQDYVDWKKLNTTLASLDVYQRNGFTLRTGSGAERAPGARVSGGFFRTLGVAPVLGRDFRAGEDLAGATPTVLLSYSAWQSRFGGRRNVLGETVILNGIPNQIIGVLPRDFHFAPAEPADFWGALQPTNPCELRRSCHSLYGVARLKEGVSFDAALANIRAIAQQLEKQYPESNRSQGGSLVPLAEVISGRVRPLLLVLSGAAGLLLLIACTNIASLLLLRAEGRRREFAVRTALGASRLRLVHQFVTEGVLLAGIGSLLGLKAASWAMQLLTKLIPPNILAGMPFLRDLGLNPRVIAFAGLVAVVAAVLFSVTPALRLSFVPTRAGLAENGRGTAGLTWRRLGAKLVALELATAMVLLVGAGLLSRSLSQLLVVELGIKPDHLATLQVVGLRTRYSTAEQRVAFARKVVERVHSLPGVISVGTASQLPLQGNGNTTWVRIQGHPYNGEHNEVNQRDVTPEYFATLQAKLIRGRYFTEADDATRPSVAVVNQAFAKQYFPGEDPIGRKIGDTSLSPQSMQEIVGIVDDIREGALDGDIWPAVYNPFAQGPDNAFSLVVRTAQAEQSLLPAMSAAVKQLDPDVVTSPGTSMLETLHGSPAAWLRRSSAWLVGGFAAVALLLGVVGLYGVVAYSVSQRTREIGIRMALGAERASVCGLIMKEAGRLTLIGIAMGLVCAVGAARLIRGLLFGVQPWDLLTLAAVAAILGFFALLASVVPARRAASVNPIEALRAD